MDVREGTSPKHSDRKSQPVQLVRYGPSSTSTAKRDEEEIYTTLQIVHLQAFPAVHLVESIRLSGIHLREGALFDIVPRLYEKRERRGNWSAYRCQGHLPMARILGHSTYGRVSSPIPHDVVSTSEASQVYGPRESQQTEVFADLPHLLI